MEVPPLVPGVLDEEDGVAREIVVWGTGISAAKTLRIRFVHQKTRWHTFVGHFLMQALKQ